jgi:type II secretory ATPase GspE/PulE/Tfp pilus assembly ATPase PilB-like protein
MPEQKMSQMDLIQKDIQKSSEDMPIVQLVDAVFRQAVAKKASDIHIEPFLDHTEVRFRIDGVLRPVMTVPKEFEAAMVSRIKVMANLDITETRQPQDGRVVTEMGGRSIDLRISTLPIIHGEKVVIRILDKGSTVFELSKLGFSENAEAMFKDSLDRPNGIILATGPTGSGKSTTLYTGLTLLNSPDVNIITLEDPVEYQLTRVNQVQVNTKVGLTFAKGLRSILRQDPDIIMVGEIRDLETAEIAIQAALTGHLVLSTLHTNDAPSSITRLLDLGVAPYLISSTVIGVMAQRLVRKICTHCEKGYHLLPEEAEAVGLDSSGVNGIAVKYGEGCPQCRGTGYQGRTGIFEIMEVNERIRSIIREKTDAEQIRKAAVSDGMTVLREAAVRKMLKGETTFDEVIRVTGEKM